MRTWTLISLDDVCSDPPASFKYRNISNIVLFHWLTDNNCDDSFYWYCFSLKAAENKQNWKLWTLFQCWYRGLNISYQLTYILIKLIKHAVCAYFRQYLLFTSKFRKFSSNINNLFFFIQKMSIKNKKNSKIKIKSKGSYKRRKKIFKKI